MADRTKIAEVRPPQGNFDLFEDVDSETIFVDGVATTSVGTSVTRLDLYEIPLTPVAVASGKTVMLNQPGAPPENRSIVVRLVIPTRTLLEFCTTTLKALKGIDIIALFEQDVAASRAILNSVDLPE